MLSVDASTARTQRVVPPDGGRLWEPWLLEGLAQTAAVLSGHAEHTQGVRTRKGMLVGIRKLSIHRRPNPGETIHFEVSLIKRIAPLSLIAGRVFVGDEVIAAGEMKFHVTVDPTDEPDVGALP